MERLRRQTTDRSDDGIAPLWRAAQIFRLVTVVYAVGAHAAHAREYSNVRLSWVFIAVLVIWSGLSAAALAQGRGPRLPVVLADQVVAVGLMAATRLVAEPEWYMHHQTLPTTLWVANAVLSAAVYAGPWAGIASAVGMAAVSTAVRGQVTFDLWTDATAPVLLAVGLAMGAATRTARRAHIEITRAARVAAVAQERERLARQVHDGVLQVLALVQRRGAALGAEGAELAGLAGEQERALRALIADQAQARVRPVARRDLRASLHALAGADVTVSAPPDPVDVPHHVADETTAAVAAALSNTRLHAGPGAHAYVLLEELDDEIVVTVRDDGVGFAPARLDEAADQGRLGVSRSIRGRVRDLGGRAEVSGEPGGGTEWEFHLPRETTGERP